MRQGLRRVVVTGLGAITSLGFDPEQVFQRLLRGESGIRLIRTFDTSGCPCKIGGTVEDFNARQFIKDRHTLRSVRMMDPVHAWALCAAKEAMTDAGLDEVFLTKGDDTLRETVYEGISNKRLGVYLGMGLSGRGVAQNMAVDMLEKYRASSGDKIPESVTEMYRWIGEMVAREINPLQFLQQCPSVAASYVAMRYQAMGPNMTCVNLCAASAQSIGESAWLIARGDADAMMAGGSDSMLNITDLTAFCALGAVTGRWQEVEKASKPFDIRRDGCVVSEGAVVLVLESLDTALARGAKIYGEIIGYGTSDDGYKLSAPPEDGEGATRSMTRALESANLEPSGIDYINAHGTSTPLNDRIETAAIKQAFGDHAYKVPISSTKSMTGHLIAAAGALEAMVSLKCIEHKKVPPTINHEKPDPRCDLDYVPDGAREIDTLETVLSNSFAIGGVNATLIFRKWRP